MHCKNIIQRSLYLNLFCALLLSSLSFQVLALTELADIELKLEPIPGPDSRAIGWEWHYVDQNGDAGHMSKVAGDDKQATYQRSDGCKWTRSTRGFAPASTWSNCPSKGSSKVEIFIDKLWPLQVGNQIVYQTQGSSSLIGRAWKTKRSCTVVKTVKIEIVSGIYDTFKVICKERWGTRTWWLAPSVGTAVAYQQTTRRNKVIRQEMVKIVNP